MLAGRDDAVFLAAALAIIGVNRFILSGLAAALPHVVEPPMRLSELVRDVPCKFNLIPFNPFPQAGLGRSSPERIRAFAGRLADAGLVTTVRRTRGDDIDAACGQLAGDILDRTRLAERAAPRQVMMVRG